MSKDFTRMPPTSAAAAPRIRRGRRTSRALAAAVVAGLLALASGARAGTATYTLSGSGAFAGTFNGVAFTNEAFTFTLVGDSGTIGVQGNYSYLNPLQSSTVSLSGIGTYKVLLPTSLGVISGAGGSEIVLNQYEPATRNVFLWDTAADVDIEQSFGTVGSDPFLESIGDVIPTSGGPLQFDSFAGYGRTITFSGTVVPEPATWALMLSGLGVTGAALRTRRNRGSRARGGPRRGTPVRRLGAAFTPSPRPGP